MQHLSNLLKIENSQLAWVLRLGLYGLRTQLQEALKQAATDPGSAICRELLQQLDELLQPKESNLTIPWEDVFEPVPPEAASNMKLALVAESLLAEQELSYYIGEYQFCSSNDGDLWNEMQRLLLRLPDKIACLQQKRILAQVSELGAWEDRMLVQQLPFYRHEHVYCGLQGDIKASGLCLSTQVNFDPRLQMQRTGTELDIWAGIVSVCLKFIEMDANLHHALKSVDRFGIRSLNLESESLKYTSALLDRFHRVLATAIGADPVTALHARLDLDEAIHSLVYLPICDRFSWWGKLQQQARRALDLAVEAARNAGHHVQIRPLWGTYADVYAFSKDDLQLDTGAVPGEVSACLRVYAKIDDEIIPGRVLFRSA